MTGPKYLDREQLLPYQLQVETILREVFSRKRCRIYLFGSRATESYHDTSDFDIGVLAEAGEMPFSLIVRDGTIQRFEYSFESI